VNDLTVNELIEILLELKEKGKGDYVIVNGELMKYINKESIEIDNFNKEIII
jgi:hypothetical protein